MSDDNIDIIRIDREIRSQLSTTPILISDLQNKLDKLLLLKKSPRSFEGLTAFSYKFLNNSINSIKEEIQRLNSNEELFFYIAETAVLIEEYKKIIRTPVKVDFMGNSNPKIIGDRSSIIISIFLNIANKYIDISSYNSQSSHKTNAKCFSCGDKNNLEINDDNGISICLNCGNQQGIMMHTSSYKDVDRVNISTKYTYDRKVHFRDCIKQYQGKQNSAVSDIVYKELENEFKKHHLLVLSAKTRKQKFKNITRAHIMLFLKELGHTKHYENHILIHSVLTDKKPDNISHLEAKLLHDFDKLTELYDKVYKSGPQQIERRNFINTQYVLYQLLLRHKHPCKKDSFTILKTIDRQSFHDDVCKKLFTLLGWNHFPHF